MKRFHDASPLSILHITFSFFLVFLNIIIGISDFVDIVTNFEPVMHSIAKDELIFSLHAFSSVVGTFVNLITLVLFYKITINASIHFSSLSLRDNSVAKAFAAFIIFNFLYVMVFFTKFQRVRYYLDTTKLNRKSVEIFHNIIEIFECCIEVYRNDNSFSTYCNSSKAGGIIVCSKEVKNKIIVPLFVNFVTYCAVLALTVAMFAISQFQLIKKDYTPYETNPQSVWGKLFRSDIVAHTKAIHKKSKDPSVDPNLKKTLKCTSLRMGDSDLDEVIKNSNMLFGTQLAPDDFYLPEFSSASSCTDVMSKANSRLKSNP